MTNYDDGSEPQRFLGFPVKPGHRWPDFGGDGQQAFGMPVAWLGTRRHLDTRWLRHPARWLRWRAQVRRRGPYAPDFDKLGPRRAERGDHGRV